MKKIILFSLSLTLFLTGCDLESPMDKDLYTQKVYIVGAHDRIVNRDLNIGNNQDTLTISVAVSGSRNSNQDVTVYLGEDPDAIDTYNTRELSAEGPLYRKLQSAVYDYPFETVTIKAGEIYNTYPIYIRTESFHCDSLYMLPLKIMSTSAYELNEEDTIALVRINLVNDYSGLYYMDGELKNTTNESDKLSYKMPRNLSATDNGNTVRMYHYNNEYSIGDDNDYRPSHTFKITVRTDNTLALTTWDEFDIIDGGGVYYPEWNAYELWYTYDNDGTIWRTDGFLYKERKTDDEQRLIEDWMELKRQ